ncbi:MAG: MBL fold metallo-hydrolase [Syntrophaceae bacterium]
MTLQFEALPVGRGDAFLLRDGDSVFLFDGGQYTDQVTKFLIDRNVSHLNAAICSHNDVDHVGGIIGILESEIRVDEVWIPASWCNFLATAAESKVWPSTLLSEIYSKPEILNDWKSCNEEKQASSKMSDESSDIDTKIIDVKLNEFLDGTLYRLEDIIGNFPLCFFLEIFLYSKDGQEYLPLIGMLAAGERIIKIIEHAYNKGCCIRFFEYNHACQSNQAAVDNTAFKPLNCREMDQIKRYPTLARSLYLTVVNRQSLVFQYSSPKGCHVLFTAESDLSFQNEKPLKFNYPTIVTAPHHGSADNKEVYGVIQGESLTWVRSDFRYEKRPCTEYIQQKIRYCTICRPAIGNKQSVAMEWDGAFWRRKNNTFPCTCK